jgi:hypothetical protein
LRLARGPQPRANRLLSQLPSCFAPSGHPECGPGCGQPNLSAPAPRVNGRPELSGIWQAESAPVGEIRQFLLPGDINGLGEDLPSKYFFNFFADVPLGQEPFQPAAAAAFRKIAQNRGKPPTLCPPPTLPLADLLPAPYKIVQTPRTMLFLYEADSVFRQVFTDGRKLPDDPQPSWLGYSVGKWTGDSFTAETVGFTTKVPWTRSDTLIANPCA